MPDTTDDVKSISLAYSRDSGLLRPGYQSITLIWSGNGHTTGRIMLEVHMLPDSEPCLRLKYTHNAPLYLHGGTCCFARRLAYPGHRLYYDS